MEKMRVSVKDGQIKVNENEGEKTSGTWRVRCHNRAGEAVTHTCTALPSGERPRLLCRPHLINPFALVNIPPLTLPQLSTLFHFHYSPLEPVRQTLRDYTIITLFPHRLELLPELTLTVWSDPPPHRDHSGTGDSHRCWWSHVWKQRQAHLLHPAGGTLLLCGAKDRYMMLTDIKCFSLN